jgi:hypothetical protein
MVRRWIEILATACLMASIANAGTDQDPKQIVRQAIAVLGGMENVRQCRAMHNKFTGRLYIQSESLEVEGETWLQFPDRMKQTAQIEIAGQKLSIACIVRGQDAWTVEAGAQRRLEGQERADLCASFHEEYVAALWPLLVDQSLTLTTVPAKSVNGRQVLGVRVAQAKQPDVTLFFDQDSHLLVLKERPRLIRDEPNAGKVQEESLADYRTLDFRTDDEKHLRQSGIDTSDASLLAFLRRQVLSEADRIRCQKLIDQLGNASYMVRRNAREELAKFGPRVAPLLRPAAKSQDLEVSTAANELLQKANAESTNAGSIPAALRLLADHRAPGAIEVILAYLPCASSDLLASGAEKALADLSTNQGKPDPSFEEALASANPAARAMARASLEVISRPPGANQSAVIPEGHQVPISIRSVPRRQKSAGNHGRRGRVLQPTRRLYFCSPAVIASQLIQQEETGKTEEGLSVASVSCRSASSYC